MKSLGQKIFMHGNFFLYMKIECSCMEYSCCDFFPALYIFELRYPVIGSLPFNASDLLLGRGNADLSCLRLFPVC